MKKKIQSRFIWRLSQILALIGISCTFAACYAPAPFDDRFYDSDDWWEYKYGTPEDSSETADPQQAPEVIELPAED